MVVLDDDDAVRKRRGPRQRAIRLGDDNNTDQENPTNDDYHSDIVDRLGTRHFERRVRFESGTD